MATPTERYTHGHDEAVLRSHRWRTATNSAAYLLPHLIAGSRLLDVGCGPGTLTVDLARYVAPGAVTGIDVAEGVVNEAAAHAERERIGNVSFQVADFRDEELEIGAFDVVHAHQVLQHLGDGVGAMARLATLTRAGGVIAVRDVDCAAFTWYPASLGLERWLAIYDAVARRNGGEPNAGRHLQAWATEAGWSEIAFTSSTWTFASPEDRVWWSELWADRTTSPGYRDQVLAYGIATAEELEEVASAWRAFAADPGGVFIAVHGEVIGRP